MNKTTEKLEGWLLYTNIGRYILRNEQALFSANTLRIFGYYALQLGFNNINFLEENKISNKYVMGKNILGQFETLPIASSSVDLIVCPHILDFSPNYKNILAECYRALIPNGKLLISGFNRISLFTLLGRNEKILKDADIVSLGTLKQELKNLQFSIKYGNFFCYAPPVKDNQTLNKLNWLEKVGNRWFPSLSSSYFLVVEKKVVAPTRIKPSFAKQAQTSFRIQGATA